MSIWPTHLVFRLNREGIIAITYSTFVQFGVASVLVIGKL